MLQIEKYKHRLRENLPFSPTNDQEELLFWMSRFVHSNKNRTVLLLKGYAGTGKTSCLTALVKVLESDSRQFELLAPTGRAAKVLAKYCESPALTIHKRIYQYRSTPEGGMFELVENKSRNKIFIVDEASMIYAQDSGVGLKRAERDLLDDLLRYVFEGENCRLMFIGDVAQLPPVGTILSQALNNDYLRNNYGLNLAEVKLTEVVRQSLDSGILYNATNIRKFIQEENAALFFELDGFDDVLNISGYELEDYLNEAYDGAGNRETIVICRSNKRAVLFNQQIRSRILWREEVISAGDLLMVVKNDYYWLDQNFKPNELIGGPGFIANGDTIEVVRVLGEQELYGFSFIEVEATLVDYPELLPITVKLIKEPLTSDHPAMTFEERQILLSRVEEDYMNIANKCDRFRAVLKDPFVNALQVKYGYAVTCHKSQGGQWANVFIDQGYLTEELVNVELLRWMYTAVTRATNKLYLVNFHERFIKDRAQAQ